MNGHGNHVGRIIAWCGVIVGLVGFGIGVAGLAVAWAVYSLIVASISGLYLLKLRSEGETSRQGKIASGG